MDPIVWGPKLWFFMHTISFNYPENPNQEDKRNYYDFFHNLKNIIPCSVCKNHYAQHLQNNPITPSLDTKQNLVQWVIDLHNEVNKTLGKKIYQYDEVINLYKKEYSTNYKESKKNNYLLRYWHVSLYVILILVCVYIYIRCYRKKKLFKN